MLLTLKIRRLDLRQLLLQRHFDSGQGVWYTEEFVFSAQKKSSAIILFNYFQQNTPSPRPPHEFGFQHVTRLDKACKTSNRQIKSALTIAFRVGQQRQYLTAYLPKVQITTAVLSCPFAMFSITTQNVKSDNNFDPRMLKSYRSKEPKTREEYEKLQRKQRANIILDHYELLMKYALENKVVSSLLLTS